MKGDRPFHSNHARHLPILRKAPQTPLQNAISEAQCTTQANFVPNIKGDWAPRMLRNRSISPPTSKILSRLRAIAQSAKF